MPEQRATPPGADDELYERLAAIQHEIWSHWMRYLMNTKAEDHGEAGLWLAEMDVARWREQAATRYELLTEAEKASDREQVDRYWQLVASPGRGDDVAGTHDLKAALIMSLGDSGVMLSDAVLDRVVDRTTRSLGRRWDSLLSAVFSGEARDA